MAETAAPLVALLGVMLESNRFAMPATEKDLESGCRRRADAILADARGDGQRLPAEARAFIRTMDATGPWQPVPIAITALYPAGPMATGLFADLVAEGDDDPDGTLIDRGQRRLAEAGGRLLDVSIFGSFVCSDTGSNGVAVLVAARTAEHLAGFAPFFAPEQVLEVDAAGLTSPVLERLAWQGLPRPVFPLGPETSWAPPDW